jgi:hypothetical protein
VIEHVDPDLSVGNNPRYRRLPEHFARRHRVDDDSRIFEKISRRLLGQLQAVFKAVNETFFFQLIKGVGRPLQGLAEQAEAIVKSLKRFFSSGFFHGSRSTEQDCDHRHRLFKPAIGRVQAECCMFDLGRGEVQPSPRF